MDWQAKQDRFMHFLQMHRAQSAEYRVDLQEEKILWVDERGQALVVADCKALLSFALSNRSILMAWANQSLTSGAIDPVEGYESYYIDCEPEDAWELAMELGDAVKAEALYRAPSPQSWVMLGLWNLRAGSGERFDAGSPAGHVLTVLEQLARHPREEELPVLLDNYSEQFLHLAEHTHHDTIFAAPLRDTARELRNLLVLTEQGKVPELRERLGQAAAPWEGLVS